MYDIDVIIPTYKPNKELFTLLDRLNEQTIKPSKIILMNTQAQELAKLISDEQLTLRYPNVTVFHLSKQEFDHGRTRHEGVLFSDAEYFMCMTQDAIPADRNLIEELVKAFDGDDQLAVSYARQIPRPDCNPEELYARKFNYSVTSIRKTLADVEKLGIKTYFCSNVCAMYKRSIYDKLGGFIRKAIFNEDMVYAGTAIKAGYATIYVPRAGVVHSHNYTCMQQFHRNFDIGVSQKDHPEIFEGLSNESEGMKMVKGTIRYLQDMHKTYRIPHYILLVGSRYVGFRLGKMYNRLPKSLVRACSLNKEYWNN